MKQKHAIPKKRAGIRLVCPSGQEWPTYDNRSTSERYLARRTKFNLQFSSISDVGD